MSMGRRRDRQRGIWLETAGLARGPGHPFYDALNRLLREHDFDAFVEERCSRFYARVMGRPSLAPGTYFRLLLVGYFEGIDSERGIAWRVADSMTLREFLGYELSDETADHSTLSRTRRLIALETHQEVFTWILGVLGKSELLRGKTFGVDATTLEANAAMRSIVRRDTGESYRDFLTRLAKESGIETPTRADLARFDRQRAKKGSNEDWASPGDPDARITKMKDGRTHLAHKAEHAVDLETGAVVAVTVQPADRGDTASLEETLDAVIENLSAVVEDDEAQRGMSATLLCDLVADRGYHSGAVLLAQKKSAIRTYIPEPRRRGRRRWSGKKAEHAVTLANRLRVRGSRGRKLSRWRCERVERSFAHAYETGGMRRLHLRGATNILKRTLIHLGGFNLGLVMRKKLGSGKPRELFSSLLEVFRALRTLLRALWVAPRRTQPQQLDSRGAAGGLQWEA